MTAPRHDNIDDPPDAITPHPATFPITPTAGTVHVPVDWPGSIRHGDRTYNLTGKIGHRISDKAQAAEYEAVDEDGHRTGERVWLHKDGTVTEE